MVVSPFWFGSSVLLGGRFAHTLNGKRRAAADSPFPNHRLLAAAAKAIR
jgi:hypothetical protein